MNETPAYKSGFATLIGRPNVGKSTLMNRLIGQKIAITSNKPQTTRNRIQTVLTLEEGQIVFLDTPGIHKAKNKLGDYMVNVAEHTLNDVDVILWLVEPTNFIGAGERPFPLPVPYRKRSSLHRSGHHRNCREYLPQRYWPPSGSPSASPEWG